MFYYGETKRFEVVCLVFSGFLFDFYRFIANFGGNTQNKNHKFAQCGFTAQTTKFSPMLANIPWLWCCDGRFYSLIWPETKIWPYKHDSPPKITGPPSDCLLSGSHGVHGPTWS